MIQIQNVILPVIALVIALVALVMSLYNFHKKESFDGAPSGYGNLLVSDNDGNLNTFSMDKLQSDIQTMINTSLNTSLNNYYTKSYIDSKISFLQNNFGNYYTKSDIDDTLNNYVKYDSPLFIANMNNKWQHLYESGSSIKVQGDMNWFGGDPATAASPKKRVGFIVSKAPAWDGGSGDVWID